MILRIHIAFFLQVGHISWLGELGFLGMVIAEFWHIKAFVGLIVSKSIFLAIGAL